MIFDESGTKPSGCQLYISHAWDMKDNLRLLQFLNLNILGPKGLISKFFRRSKIAVAGIIRIDHNTFYYNFRIDHLNF